MDPDWLLKFCDVAKQQIIITHGKAPTFNWRSEKEKLA